MVDYFKKVTSQINDFIGSLSPMKKVALVTTAFVILFGIGGLFWWAGDQSFRPLMTNLNGSDQSAIMRVLREQGIPFKVDSSGRSISVPSENLYDLRLMLATQGLPESSVVGYEIFDKQSLGTTSFVQRVNRTRALEGELMRTIKTIKGVRRARVHLAIPKKSPFLEEQKKPTASVVVDLEPSTRLTDKQIYGIGVMVSRAVEGLDVADVVILDSSGKTLSSNPRDPLIQITATQMDFQKNLEESMEKRIQSMVEAVVGEGRVVARVSAEMDFSLVNETATSYDADGSAVVSRQQNQATMDGKRPGPQGRPGVQSNQPGPRDPAGGDITSNTTKNRETVNYKVPQTVRTTRKPYGTVKKLSVAVLLDKKETKSRDQKTGEVNSSVSEWSETELKEFEKIVAKAVGFNVKRGDELEIKTMAFSRVDFAEAERIIQESTRRTYLRNLISYLVIGLLIVLFFVFVVRPYIKWVTENTIDSVDSFLPQTIEELERLQKNANLPGLEESIPVMPEKVDPEKVEGEMIKEKVITLVDSNPHKATLILADWLHDDKDRKKKDAEA